MIITPFAFMAEQAAPAWTPADFTGLKYWYRADSGLTLSGTDVQAWAVASGSAYTLEDQTSTAPTYVSSYAGWNNREAIEFNNGVTTDALQSLTRYSVGTSDYHFVWWIAEAPSNASGGYQIIGGDFGPDGGSQEFVLESNNPSSNNAWTTYNLQIEVAGASEDLAIGGAISSFKGWTGIAVDNSTKNGYVWVNGTETSIWTGGLYGWADGTRGSGAGLIVGNYGIGQSLGFKGHIFEVGVLTSKPTATEITNMETYINTYYGVTYSN